MCSSLAGLGAISAKQPESDRPRASRIEKGLRQRQGTRNQKSKAKGRGWMGQCDRLTWAPVLMFDVPNAVADNVDRRRRPCDCRETHDALHSPVRAPPKAYRNLRHTVRRPGRSLQ